jgi:hypothetical protein
VIGLKSVDAIFDTGTTMIVGDPVGIMKFFAPLQLSSDAEEIPDNPGYYSSTWANLAADLPSQLYLICLKLESHSPMQLQYSHLHLCWREGDQDFP